MFSNKRKYRLYWTLQIGGWSFYAFLHILLLFLDKGLIGLKLTSILLTAGYFLVTTHLFRYLVLRMGWLNYRMTSLIPSILLSTVILGITNYAFEIGISYLLHTLTPQDLAPFIILAYVIGAMAWYMLWSAVYFLYHYVEKTNSSLKYEAALFEIELNQLKSQLNPHFIFNALNSIRALIDEDPGKSKMAITQLSNILRNSLVTNRRKLIELQDELRTVKDYLALESIRFEERLSVELNVEPQAESYLVPPLMIQTLIENCIKHGISKLTRGGLISLDAFIDDRGDLLIEIRNSGQFANGSAQDTTGYGLENTRRRLNLLFGDKATLEIGNENAVNVLTRLHIPQTSIYESIDHR